MGLDTGHVISDVRHHGHFICSICQNLAELDCLVTTPCSHVFCKQCLSTWIVEKGKTTCPASGRDLLFTNNRGGNGVDHSMMMGDRSVMVQPLERAQPLAHRLLKSIQVKCPLGSPWEGSYGDLQEHLLRCTSEEVAIGNVTTGSNTNTAASSLGTRATANVEIETIDEDSTSSVPQPQKENDLALASSLKEQANSQFEISQFEGANSLYTRAISLLTPYFGDATETEQDESSTRDVMSLLTALYSNRAASYLQLLQYGRCLDDCNYALQKLDPNNVKCYTRAIRACIQLGELKRAADLVAEALRKEPENGILQKDSRQVELMREWERAGERELRLQQYADAKTRYSSLLKRSPSAAPFLLGAAMSDLGLGLTDSVLRLTKRVLMQNAANPQGCATRGQALFLMGEYKSGIQLLQEALRLDPDDDDIKRSYKIAKKVKESAETAKQKVFFRQFTEAIDLVTSAIQQYEPTLPPKSPLYAILHTLCAQAYLRLKRYKEALKECAVVLYAQEDHIPAWLVRFQSHHGLGDHETAMEEVKDILRKLPEQPELRKAYHQADFLLRKARRVDYYKLLGCSQIASEMEIKKAYKRKALELHPDRIEPGSSDKKVKEAQKNFQLLGEGLEILSDDFTRKLYDEGYDPEAIRERVEAAKQAAHRHREGCGRH